MTVNNITCRSSALAYVNISEFLQLNESIGQGEAPDLVLLGSDKKRAK